MCEWIKIHQKTMSLGLGALMIVGAMGMLFWSTMNTPVISQEEKHAQASIARMQARTKGTSVTHSTTQTSTLEQYYKSRDQQLRYLMIVMIISGLGLLTYGFLKKS